MPIPAVMGQEAAYVLERSLQSVFKATSCLQTAEGNQSSHRKPTQGAWRMADRWIQTQARMWGNSANRYAAMPTGFPFILWVNTFALSPFKSRIQYRVLLFLNAAMCISLLPSPDQSSSPASPRTVAVSAADDNGQVKRCNEGLNNRT